LAAVAISGGPIAARRGYQVDDGAGTSFVLTVEAGPVDLVGRRPSHVVGTAPHHGAFTADLACGVLRP
jgi:hypothetical protein